MIFIYICIGLLIGGLGIYFILRPKLRKIAQYNQEIENQNKELENKNRELKSIYNIEETNLKKEKETYNLVKEQVDQLQETLTGLKTTATQNAKEFYEQALEISQNSFDQEIAAIARGLEEARDEAKAEYLETLKEAVANFQNEISNKSAELAELSKKFIIEQQNVNAAVEAAKRRQQMENEKDFYRLQLSQADIEEIRHLREVVPFLRDPEPLNKVIYKVYYEKPYVDLIGRVIGQDKKTGIYKITNLLDEKCYVGQSVNISERWKQHIRRGVGADAPTRNKLYPAMLATGVENFSFELVEECPADQLDEREKFWQSYFHAQDYGYSIR